MRQYTITELQAMKKDDLIHHIMRLYMEYDNLEDDYKELERKYDDDFNDEYTFEVVE
jgi:hypothetical protein